MVWFISSSKGRNNMKRQETPKQHADFSEYWQDGFDAGYSAASWCDMPSIGDRVDTYIDWVGYGPLVTEDNIRDYHAAIAYAAEDNSRQYSPFEFTASEINALDEWESDAAWSAYDDGIAAGIDANLSERYPIAESEEPRD